jgi:rfaE bifunctional protein kinase chain/domain
MDLNKLNKYIAQTKGKKIAVVGDVMIDHYIVGKVERISPEAPVPILDAKADEYRLGGAANVALNISTLGAEALLIGVIGDDINSDIIKRLLEEKSVSSDYLVTDNSRPTTIKTRVTSHMQQIVRIDREVKHDIGKSIEDAVIAKFNSIVDDIDAVIIEDYNKGLLSQRVITSILEIASAKEKIITVDPKMKNFFDYKNVTVFKPNLLELAKNMGVIINDDHDLHNVAWKLFEKINPENLIVTLGERGMLIFKRDKKIISLPTYAREVFDVSGAGDTVISTLTLALSISNSVHDSAVIANHAAGVVCGKNGTSSVYWEEITESIEQE